MPCRAPARSAEKGGATGRKQAQAFVTARKRFSHLTIRFLSHNRELMYIRAYKIDPVEAPDMRRV